MYAQRLRLKELTRLITSGLIGLLAWVLVLILWQQSGETGGTGETGEFTVAKPLRIHVVAV